MKCFGRESTRHGESFSESEASAQSTLVDKDTTAKKQPSGQTKSKQFNLPCKVGYAWFFENTVIYGTIQDVLTVLRSRNAKSKHGQFVGIVKGLIPVDPYYVLYEYLKHSKRFLQRQRERKFRHRMGITKQEMRAKPILKGEGDNRRIIYQTQAKLRKWCKHRRTMR